MTVLEWELLEKYFNRCTHGVINEFNELNENENEKEKQLQLSRTTNQQKDPSPEKGSADLSASSALGGTSQATQNESKGKTKVKIINDYKITNTFPTLQRCGGMKSKSALSRNSLKFNVNDHISNKYKVSHSPGDSTITMDETMATLKGLMDQVGVECSYIDEHHGHDF